LQDRGLLTRAANVISLSPPLCITEAEVDRIVEIIDDSLTEMEQGL
jgi:adenosylmethionine-8-amino-7-oxononanoate aminotransferase